MFNAVKDHGGKRAVSVSGGVREEATGKGRFDLIPSAPHKRLAQHYENGAKKYADRNWEKGLVLSRFMDSAERHLNDFKSGDRSEDHLAAILWNIYGYIHTEQMVEQGKLPAELRDVPWPPSVPLPAKVSAAMRESAARVEKLGAAHEFMGRPSAKKRRKK